MENFLTRFQGSKWDFFISHFNTSSTLFNGILEK